MSALMVAGMIGFITIAILIWDVWLYSDEIPRNSITQVIIDLTAKSPMTPALIGFFTGLLFGHFWG